MEKILITILLLCSFSVLLAQTTWYVYEENENRDAIYQVIHNDADHGDEIIVYRYGGGGQGTYGGFDYEGKDLDIHSQNYNSKVPIYDVNKDVIIDMSEITIINWNASPSLRGFTITGRSDAIGIQLSDLGVLYADIEHNVIDGVEIGIFLEENLGGIDLSDNEIKNCDIAISNQETVSGGGSGDDFVYNNIHDNEIGIYLGLYSNTFINNSTIYDNTVAGIQQEDISDLSVSDCSIYSNDIGYSCGLDVDADISYSLFYDNCISIYLTDDYYAEDKELTLSQCTISNTDPYTADNGIYVDDNSDLTIINSILYGNARQIDDHGGTISVTYSDVEGDYTGTGNIDSDPYFCMEANYEFHLMEGSPCIDTGAPNQTDSDGTRIDMGCYPATTDIKYCEGNHWNWVSFPRLDRDDNDPVDAPPILEDFLDWAFDLSMEDGLEEILAYTAFLNSWNPSTYNIKSTEGFKLDPEDNGDHYLPSQPDATRLDPDWTLETMYAETGYFLGYWLPQTKNIEVAFGDFFEDVFSVEAEDWYYEYSTKETPSSSTENKNMVYGKAYIIVFDSTVEDFCWNDSGIGLDLYEKQGSEYFTFVDLPCYEVIDVLDIPENVIEIGVFEDEICVGAVVVQDTMEQILAYTTNANRDQSILTFEIVTNERQDNQRITSYLVLNQETGIFENRLLVAGQQKHSIITFGDPSEFPEDDQNVNCVVLNSNYPNPFNPVTNISFSLPQEQDIELTVYNMKGQRVCQLVKGHYLSGEHSVTWDGSNDAGKAVASGLYLYKLKTSDQIISKKMLMLK